MKKTCKRLKKVMPAVVHVKAVADSALRCAGFSLLRVRQQCCEHISCAAEAAAARRQAEAQEHEEQRKRSIGKRAALVAGCNSSVTSAYMLQELADRVTSADGERGGLSGLGMMGNDVLHRMGAKNRAPKAPRGAERCPRCETSNRSESFETFQTTQALDSTQHL